MCHLVFVHPDQYLSQEEEFRRYEQHNNDPEDPRYRAFLGKLQRPVAAYLRPNARGLDFGSGPGPLLNIMFEEMGHTMAIFDAFYASDRTVFDRRYDFITLSETIEHLQDPLKELELLWSCLKPGGVLGIMTGIYFEDIDFKKWYYTRDETHVAFFSLKTFDWLAQAWNTQYNLVGDSVVIFHKRIISKV